MTFQTDSLAFDLERHPVAFDGAYRQPAFVDDVGERTIRLSPKHADGARDVRVRWSLQGVPDAPVVIVQGGISANRHAATTADSAGWWDALVGPARAIDTTRLRVLAIDWLELTDLGDARAVDSADQADALAALLDAFGSRAYRPSSAHPMGRWSDSRSPRAIRSACGTSSRSPARIAPIRSASPCAISSARSCVSVNASAIPPPGSISHVASP